MFYVEWQDSMLVKDWSGRMLVMTSSFSFFDDDIVLLGGKAFSSLDSSSDHSLSSVGRTEWLNAEPVNVLLAFLAQRFLFSHIDFSGL